MCSISGAWTFTVNTNVKKSLVLWLSSRLMVYFLRLCEFLISWQIRSNGILVWTVLLPLSVGRKDASSLRFWTGSIFICLHRSKGWYVTWLFGMLIFVWRGPCGESCITMGFSWEIVILSCAHYIFLWTFEGILLPDKYIGRILFCGIGLLLGWG